MRIEVILNPTYLAEELFFVSVDGGAIGKTKKVIPSSFAKDGRVYLLDVPPGEYAVVAARYFQPGLMGARGNDYFIYFSRALIERTRMSASAGILAFGGDIVVDTSFNVCENESDDLQLFYAELLTPGRIRCGFLKQFLNELATNSWYDGRSFRSFGGTPGHYRGSLREAKHGDAEIRNFMQQAKDDLAGSGWDVFIR